MKFKNPSPNGEGFLRLSSPNAQLPVGQGGGSNPRTAATGKPENLGIDAAWTIANDSDVALVRKHAGRWQLLAVPESHADFNRLAGTTSHRTELDPPQLLASAQSLASASVDLIAADIPLSHAPIVGRRESDNAVSRLYGAMHAGTHSSSALRPGLLADRMREGFFHAGYRLQTAPPVRHGLIEVYPHPALIELASATRRLSYKASKTAKYWPNLSRPMRRDKLLETWAVIVGHLEARIDGVAAQLPLAAAESSGKVLKSFEDALDAVVCAWVGACALDDCAIPLGDAESAIWVPRLTLAPSRLTEN